MGYGAQVYQNMQNGQSFSAALTTDIDAGKIVAGAVVGAVVGGTLGAAAPALTTYGTVAIAQAQTTVVAAAAAHPTATAMVGGVAETAVECSMTGGGCGAGDYVAGALTAGVAQRLSTPSGGSSKNPVQIGDAGSYGSLSTRGVRGDGLTPHHMPQAAHGFTSYQDGGAIVMPHLEHTQTRNFAGRSTTAMASDQGLSFRDILARDIWDLRSIGGSTYNRGSIDLIDYYKNNFPGLME